MVRYNALHSIYPKGRHAPCGALVTAAWCMPAWTSGESTHCVATSLCTCGLSLEMAWEKRDKSWRLTTRGTASETTARELLEQCCPRSQLSFSRTKFDLLWFTKHLHSIADPLAIVPSRTVLYCSIFCFWSGRAAICSREAMPRVTQVEPQIARVVLKVLTGIKRRTATKTSKQSEREPGRRPQKGWNGVNKRFKLALLALSGILAREGSVHLTFVLPPGILAQQAPTHSPRVRYTSLIYIYQM